MRSSLSCVGWLLIGCGMAGCGPDYVKRFDEPLSYEQMLNEREIDFPLPRSSRNIRHARFSDWQALAHLVRFEAPVEDCLKHIDTVLAWEDKTYRRIHTYDRVPVTHVDGVDAGLLEPTTWFDPEKITNGIFTGKRHAGNQPQIWIDLDRGIFYYRKTD